MVEDQTYFDYERAAVQAYLRGRLEYARFLRQLAKIQDMPLGSPLPSLSVLDFYPSDLYFGDIENYKLTVLSCYVNQGIDEEKAVEEVVQFLSCMQSAFNCADVQWVIVASDTDMELVNVVLAYSLMSEQLNSEQGEDDTVDSSEGNLNATLIANSVKVISYSDLNAIWKEAVIPFDCFWPGLGEWDVLADSQRLFKPLPILGLDRSHSLIRSLLRSWELFQEDCQQQAQQAFRLDNWDEALDLYHQSLRYGGLSTINWNNLAITYLKRNQLALAYQASNLAITIDPHRSDNYCTLGLILEAQGDPSALQAYQISIQCNL